MGVSCGGDWWWDWEDGGGFDGEVMVVMDLKKKKMEMVVLELRE